VRDGAAAVLRDLDRASVSLVDRTGDGSGGGLGCRSRVGFSAAAVEDERKDESLDPHDELRKR